jgi:P-type Mg2+ transporter
VPASYWSVQSEDLLKQLESSDEGLSATEAAARLVRFGPNILSARKHATALGLFLNQFKSPIILILIFATLISAALKDWPDAVIILIIVLGSALLSFWQEYGANNAAEKLRSQVSLKAVVLRDNQTQTIPTEQVVPGDVLLLSAGSLVPGDGVLLESKDFHVNQAVLTGETFPVDKAPGIAAANASLAERQNVVFMGTNVSSGTARVLIVQTGASTAFGQIATRLTLRPPETEFERGIRRLGYLLTEIMLLLVLTIFALNVLLSKPPLDSLLFSIALAVGLTPQLLPAIININLSKGSETMAAGGVIVRRLEAIENFGSMDILCTDKTGTLTEGVVKLDASMDVRGQPSPEVFRYAYLNAHFQTGLANPLDQAITSGPQPEMQGLTKIDEVPYDFVRKRLSVVVEQAGRDQLIAKGALDNILAVSTSVLLDGKPAPFDKDRQASIQELYEKWYAQGYRVLGVAVKDVANLPRSYDSADEKELTFVGFLLFFDPPKPGVKDTIQKLARLGVQLKIITGDNHLVARHTAEAVGLEDAQVLTGAEVSELRDEALWHSVEKTTIFAEVDPNEKERIILALKKRGHVVGYMGDGINDAPSLHSADVGISVDNAVDVAKEAADFVLLQSDLEILQRGIIQGRKTFANSLKYVFMATSANFGNMFSMAGASLFLPYLPMLPKQILLINFLTDLPEMTIAGDNVDEVFVERPHRWDLNFIQRFMIVFGPLSSIFDFITFGVLLLIMHADQASFHTGWFVESVLSAGLVVFALRTQLPVFRSRPSRPMLFVTAMVMLVTLALPYSPLAGLLGFTPLQPAYLLAIVMIMLLYFLSAELTKRWFFHRYLK